MIYIFLANGFEDIEALYVFDVLKRAGFSVALVNTTSETDAYVTSAHNLTIKTDVFIDDVVISDMETLVLPGGLPGADNLSNNPKVIDCVSQQIAKQGIVAAICAAPSRVLGKHHFLDNKRFTCYPSEEQYVPHGTYMKNESVVQDGVFITSKGVGTVHLFAYAIIERLKDTATADLVFKQILLSE